MHSVLQGTPVWTMFVTEAVKLLMVVNASFNLPIYYFAGQQFRTTFHSIFTARSSSAVVVAREEEAGGKTVVTLQLHSNNNVAVTQL